MSGIKLKNPWWVAGGSTIGLIVGNGAIVLFTFGILLTPIMMEFGWTRGGAGTAMFVSHVTAALATPFVGMLIDRYGIRKTSLSFITLFSLSIAAISLTPASPHSLPDAVKTLEKRMIYEALTRNNWNKTRASIELKISRRNLIRLVQKYELESRKN